MRLFVSDLDGTLLDAHGRLSARTRELLVQQLALGLPLVVASARSIETIAPIFEGVDLRLPVIEFNGACITELQGRRCLRRLTLQPNLAEAIVCEGHAAGIAAVLATHDGERQRLHPPEAETNGGMQWYLQRRRQARDPRLTREEPTKHSVQRGVVCITLVGRPRPIWRLCHRLEQLFGERVQTLCYDNRYQPGWQWLTVQAPGATKGAGLAAVAEQLSIPLEATTAFGDEVNDLPLFEAAGHAVAVKNAVAPLKEKADEIIGPHHEDSVSLYLERHWPAPSRGQPAR